MLIFFLISVSILLLSVIHNAMKQDLYLFNPIFIVSVYYLLNYPLRLLLILLFPNHFNYEWHFEYDELTLAIVFVFIYLVFFYSTYFILCQRSHIRFHAIDNSVNSTLSDYRSKIVVALVLFSCAFTLCYTMVYYGKFSVGVDIESLSKPFFLNVISIPSSAKWAAIILSFAIYLKSGQRYFLFIILLFIFYIIFDLGITTSKSQVINALLSFMFADLLINNRRIRLWLILPVFIFSFVGALYSYYIRYYTNLTVTGLSTVADNILLFTNNISESFTLSALITPFDRLTYYFDAIAIMIRNGVNNYDPCYSLGSVVELINIMPKAVGITETSFSFDRYVTSAVWKSNSFAEYFIGRVGEAYFILGWFGVVFAIINGLIFYLLARSWSYANQSYFGIALYSGAIIGWIAQDASMFYGIKNLISIILVGILVTFISNIFKIHSYRSTE